MVTNQGTCFVWDTSYDILPLSQFICFESFRFISFKFKFRGAVGPRGVSRRSGDVWCHGFVRHRGNHVCCGRNLMLAAFKVAHMSCTQRQRGGAAERGEAHVGRRGAVGWSGLAGIASGSG